MGRASAGAGALLKAVRHQRGQGSTPWRSTRRKRPPSGGQLASKTRAWTPTGVRLLSLPPLSRRQPERSTAMTLTTETLRLHVRFEGRSEDLDLAALGLGPS